MTKHKLASDVIKVSEKDFEKQIRQLAKMFGWSYYHPFLSKWSERGYPDVTLCRPPRLIMAELKSDKGKLSPAQAQWLWMLRKVPGIEVRIWRPRMLERIAEILRQ